MQNRPHGRSATNLRRKRRAGESHPEKQTSKGTQLEGATERGVRTDVERERLASSCRLLVNPPGRFSLERHQHVSPQHVSPPPPEGHQQSSLPTESDSGILWVSSHGLGRKWALFRHGAPGRISLWHSQGSSAWKIQNSGLPDTSRNSGFVDK